MLKYILFLAILIGALLPQTAKAQTPLLQALIDATPAGGTLTLPSAVVYPCNCVIRQSIHIQSSGVRPVQAARGQIFYVGAKVISPNADPEFYIQPGVDGVSFDGIEGAPLGFVYDLVRVGTTGPAQDTTDEEPRNVSFHNVWFHGLPDQDS